MSGKVLILLFRWPMLGSFGVVPEVSGLGYDHFILVAYGFELGTEGGQVTSKLGIDGCRVPGVDEVGFEELLQGIG